MQESDIQNLIRIEYTKKGWRLFRNNVGAGKLENGNFVRWGLANETAQMNKLLKSSDLIGIRPILITEDMVGTVIGQFVALEVKNENWEYKGTDREIAQKKFIDLVNKMGGYAKFIKNTID